MRFTKVIVFQLTSSAVMLSILCSHCACCVFQALKGLLRLQALVRGRLVRRQAASTLRTMEAIVRVQALFRGRRVRKSKDGRAVRSRVSRTRRHSSRYGEVYGVRSSPFTTSFHNFLSDLDFIILTLNISTFASAENSMKKIETSIHLVSSKVECDICIHTFNFASTWCSLFTMQAESNCRTSWSIWEVKMSNRNQTNANGQQRIS